MIQAPLQSLCLKEAQTTIHAGDCCESPHAHSLIPAKGLSSSLLFSLPLPFFFEAGFGPAVERCCVGPSFCGGWSLFRFS